MPDKQIKFKGSNVFYRVSGYGIPVVLIHGFGEDGQIWNKQVAALETFCHLIIPDIPGSGQSELIREEQTGMETYAACVQQILSEENISHCVMIGHSMGGYITLAFSELFPEQLMAWGLFHSSAYADSEEKKETRKKAIEFILQHGPGSFLETSIPGLFSDKEKHKKDIEELVEKGQAFQDMALVQYYEAMISRPDRTKQLTTSTVPVLMIMGLHDMAVPFSQSLSQAYLPSSASIHILRESAHMGMLEETGKANEILAYFLHNLVMLNK